MRIHVEVEQEGLVERVSFDPIEFFADFRPDEIRLFEEAIGTERFEQMQEGVVIMAGKRRDGIAPELLALYSAPDVIAAMVNIRLRAYDINRPLDAPVGYRNADGEVDDMRKVPLG